MLLNLENVSKTYPSEVPVQVLSQVNFKLDEGRSVAITGPSGSGKSTLLNAIGGLTSIDEGKISFEDQDLASLDPKAMAHFRNQKIGFVFQQHLLLPQLSLIDNILMPSLAFYEQGQQSAYRERAIQLLSRVGLLERKDHRPGQCSGGECQRAAVVRALINKPRLLLADEPTGSLDQKTASSPSKLLLELNQEEAVALIIVTHSAALVDLIPDSYALQDGRLERIH